MKTKILFGCLQRWVIIEYYKRPESFNSKPLCVVLLENLKARREFQQHLDKSIIFKAVDSLAKSLNRISFLKRTKTNTQI